MANTECNGLERGVSARRKTKDVRRRSSEQGGKDVADSVKFGGVGRGPGPQEEEGRGAHAEASGRGWWATEPDVGRVAHGVANKLDILRSFTKGEF